MKLLIEIVIFASLVLVATAKDESALESWLQDIVPFIGNGTISEQMPFMVSIRRSSQELISQQFGNGHVCGGVILSRSHILTAASCLETRITRVPHFDIIVIAGTRYRYDSTGTERREPRNVSIHPGYTDDPLHNNLAIIELNSTLPEDWPEISPITLNNATVAAGLNCQIFGWGLPLSMHGPRELLSGNINIVNNNVCRGNMENRFCAGPDFISGCAGDDGGPVVCNGILYGLIDFTDIHYCNNSVPGRHTAYINIADYYDWIMEHLPPTPVGDGNNGVTQMVFSSAMLISAAAIVKMFK